jgi:hypothetical protein
LTCSFESKINNFVRSFQRYLQTDPTDRNHDAALIIKLHQGEEDKSFTTLFPNWDEKLWEVKWLSDFDYIPLNQLTKNLLLILFTVNEGL